MDCIYYLLSGNLNIFLQTKKQVFKKHLVIPIVITILSLLFYVLKLLAISEGQGLHGEDLVHQFPGPETVLIDHVLSLVVTHGAVLVTHPVMP